MHACTPPLPPAPHFTFPNLTALTSPLGQRPALNLLVHLNVFKPRSVRNIVARALLRQLHRVSLEGLLCRVDVKEAPPQNPTTSGGVPAPGSGCYFLLLSSALTINQTTKKGLCFGRKGLLL